MFEIKNLEDKLGYERWVLRESVIAIEKTYGIQSDSTVKFELNGTKTHKIEIYEEFGAEKRAEVLEKLSPLLFVTSYKVVDMIIEWILEANVSEVPFQFSRKVDLYEELIDSPKFRTPHSLKDEKQLLIVLFALYKKLAIYRNKIIHGNWGEIAKGDLSFSFIDKGIKYEITVHFKDVLNLAEAVSLISDELISESENSSAVLMTVKFLFDKLKYLHESIEFNISKPRHYKIEYEIENNTNINVKYIRDYLIRQSFGMPVTFTLLILSEVNNWKLPWNEIKKLDEISLESGWDKYIV